MNPNNTSTLACLLNDIFFGSVVLRMKRAHVMQQLHLRYAPLRIGCCREIAHHEVRKPCACIIHRSDCLAASVNVHMDRRPWTVECDPASPRAGARSRPARRCVIGSFPQGCQMAKFDPFLSLDCAWVEGVGAQSKERKGSNFAAQRSGAIVQKPEGPNTYNLKIWL